MTIYSVAVSGYDYGSDKKVMLHFFREASSPEIAESIVSQSTRVNALEKVTFIRAKAC
jgi:hypothetical protein